MRVGIDGMLLRGCFTGVENAILNLARALADHGTERYCLYVPKRSPSPDMATDRFQTSRTPVPVRNRLLRILWEQIALPARMGRDGIDLLHAPGYIAPLASGVPVVLTVYDLIALRHPRWCKRSNALHYGLMLPPSVRKAARIIVPSEATRRDVAERFPAASPKVRVIPLGVGEQYRRLADRGAVRRACDRYGLPERFILFVGTQEPKKNVPGLLRAFQLLRSGGSCAHKLALAGRRGWGRADVPARIRELGLTGEVVMTGYVPDGDLVCLYNAADLFVFPSLYEGFGLPPLEAMACGVPVVCSTAGGLADVVAGAALTAEPGDAPALAAAMREGLTDAALRGRLAAAGSERAAQFTWRRHAEQVERLYREVLLISGDR